jgi:DNA-binding transcriptional MerR regulator
MIFPNARTVNEEPLYNIGLVARITQISVATLRAWEHRYGFPETKRTPGGHRLYSERDILRLKWVKARIDEGMQTAQAIHALQHQEDEGKWASESERILETQQQRRGKNFLLHFHNQLLKALIHHDLEEANQLLGEALGLSSIGETLNEVIIPTMISIGEAWERGDIDVATEHLATQFFRQHLLLWMASGPLPRSISPIILACAPGELHEIGLLMLGVMLRQRRFPIIFLGQSVPLRDLANFVEDIKPSLIVLSAVTEETARSLVEWTKWMPEVAHLGKPLVGYGGRIFTVELSWRTRIPGIFLGEDLNEAIEKIEQLLR